VASPAQLIEQLAVHVTWQVEPAAHDTLPLAPTVTSHDAFVPQSMLHDSLQLPVHSASAPQSSEQLPLGPQVLGSNPHASPAGHEQLAPLQSGGGGSPPPPHAASKRNTIDKKPSWVRIS
jgi:hypothetical protein